MRSRTALIPMMEKGATMALAGLILLALILAAGLLLARFGLPDDPRILLPVLGAGLLSALAGTAFLIRRAGRRAAPAVAIKETAGPAKTATSFKERRLINALSGLADRRALERDVRAKTENWGKPILVLDVLGFEKIAGRANGESSARLLKALCDRLGQNCRVFGRLFQLSDTRFAVLVEGQPSAGKVADICHFLRLLVREPFVLPDGEFSLDLAVGATVIGSHDQHIREVLARAERGAARAAGEMQGQPVYEPVPPPAPGRSRPRPAAGA
ncbi:GGDEF domain-containing protein [Rhizobium rhizosphaerae]|nr:diguanylate cyclase [Xaviernesmea rhizosphaerae]